MTNRKGLNQVFTSGHITSDSGEIGNYIIHCNVKRFVDTRNLTSKVAYLIQCTLRTTIPNTTKYKLPGDEITEYGNYPAILKNTVSLSYDSQSIEECYLDNYYPKTINSSVSKSDSTENDNGLTLSNSHSSGSVDSQTNSFTMGASLGFFGGDLTGGIDDSLTNSDTSSIESSGGSSESYSFNTSTSHQDSMSIKDWGCYAQLDNDSDSVNWYWAQEYPWDIFTYCSPMGEGSPIKLPQYVVSRMYNDGQVLPPSQLSLFGIDFVSKVRWCVVPQNNIIPDGIKVDVSMEYVTALHRVASGALSANLVSEMIQPVPPVTLDLPLIALNALKPDKYAVVGFIKNKFDVNPDGSNTFQITSDSNDLLIRGQGFTSQLNTDFSAGNVSLSVYFKVSEVESNISISFKHWCKGQAGVTLNIIVNGNDDTPIIRQLNTLEGQTGSVLTEEVSLRYRDFSSVDYCDLLVMGLNTIKISITQPESEGCIYVLHALAVG